MKNVLLFLTILILSVSYSFSQSFHVIENFDTGDGGFTSSRSASQQWTLTTDHARSVPNSFLGKVPTTSGYSIILTSPEYDLTIYNFVYLHFDHICKVSVDDTIRIEYSQEINAGVWSTWQVLPASSYTGNASRYMPQMAFNEASYPLWDMNNNSNPTASWWQHESFDLFSVVGGANTKFRFVLKKGPNPTSFMRYGWLIDNFELIGEVFENKTPTVELVNPIVADTVTTTGPFRINAKVKTNTSYPIKQPNLVYTSSFENNSPQTSSLSMQNMSGDSLWQAEIPVFIMGTSVTYFIVGEDMMGNADTVQSSFYIKNPVSDSNSVALESFDAPLQWQVQAGNLMNIDITIRNIGIKNLDSVLVSWTLNGDTIDVFTWKPKYNSLPWNFTDSLIVGSYTPRPDKYDTIVVWISMPNGEDDPNNIDNRRVTRYLYGCIGGLAGEYIVGPNPGAHYANLGDILSIIQKCHLKDDVVIKLQDTTYTTGWSLMNLKDVVNDKTITIASLSGIRDNVVIKLSSGVAIALSNVSNLIFNGISIEKTSSGNSIEFSNACENITINNCKIKTAGGNAIYASSGVTGSNLTLKNSLIDGASTAIYFLGTTANRHKNIIIDSNEFINTTGTSLSIQRCLINSISYNTITAHPTSGSTWKGIYITDTPKGGKVIGNKIYSVNNVNTTKLGIEITSSTTDSLFLANNEIHISYIGTSTSNGIRFNGVTNSQCLHNTVLLTGSGQLRAFLWDGTNNNISLLNNIFVANGNNSATYAFYTTNNYSYSPAHQIDYNNYYSSGSLASVSGVTRATLSELQAVITSNIHSVNLYPDFIDSSVDLRSNDYNPFFCPVLPHVSTDKTGNPRVGTTNMGCYTSNYQTNAELVEILNWSQTPIATDMDSIYAVIRNGGHSILTAATISYTMNGTTYTSNWNGSIVTNEKDTIYLGKISYQKKHNNLMVCISSLTPNDNLSLDDTLRLCNYACPGALSAGTYTVGNSAADSFVDLEEVALHLTQCGISGSVTINFPNGTYIQNTSIGRIPGSSATNTVTISSVSGNREDVIFQRSDNGLSMQAPVMLEGGSNIIFKNISFSGVSPHSNPNYSYAQALRINAPSRNITIENCHLYVPDGVGTSNDNHAVIRVISVSSDIQIINSLIEGGFTGIRIDGQATTVRTNNITIQNNIIANVDGNGIYLNNANANILQNTITQRSGDFNQTNNFIGIYSISSRGNIIGNKIHAIAISAGIYTSNFNVSGQRGLICNNEIIGNVKNNNAGNRSGIYLHTSSYADVYHNSLLVSGSYTPPNSIYFVSGICVNSSNTGISIKNNQLITNTTTLNYPLYLYMTTNTGTWDIGGNNYYSQTGIIGYAQGGIKDMEMWRKIVHTDITSVNVNPLFQNPANNLALLDYTGITATMLSQVPDDIHNMARTNPATIGAYQYEYKNNDVRTHEIVEPLGTVVAGMPITVKFRIQNLGLDTLKNVMIGYKFNGQITADQFWTGILAQNEFSDTISLSTAITPVEGMNYLTIYTYAPNGQTDAFAYNDTLTSEIYACSGGPINGTYTINPDGSEDFTTFTEVTNILTSCGISGPVTIYVVPDTYNENVELGTIPGSNATNTVTFIPSSLIGNVSVVADKTAVTLTNVSHVYFKNISLYGSEKAIVFKKTCNDIEFRECNIVTDTVATTNTYRCIFYENAEGSGERLYNVRLINNLIKGGYNSIHFTNPGSDYSNMGYLIIDSNRMDKVYAYSSTVSAAVFISGFAHLESFSNNIVTTRSAAIAQRGVLLQNLWITGKVNGNRIVVNSTSSNSYVFQLINVNNGSEFYNTYGNALITNNEIVRSSLVGGTGTGVRFESTNADFFHNSVLLNMFSGGTGYAVQIYSTDRSLKIKNNIFLTHGSASYTALPVTLGTNNNRVSVSRDAGTELDYNNYYNINGQSLAMLGYQLNPNNFDMDFLREITGQDEHSTNILPTFIDNSISLKLSSVADFQVPMLQEVMQDFKGNNRLQPTYMGAHDGVSETIIDAGIVSFIGFDEAMADGNSYPVSVVIRNNGNTPITLSSANLSYSVNGTLFAPIPAPQKLLAYNQFDTVSLGSHIFTGRDTLSATITLAGDVNLENNAIKVIRKMCNERLSGTYTTGASTSNFSNFGTFWTKAQQCEVGGDITLQFETGTYSGTINLSDWNNFSNGHTLTITSAEQHQDSVRFTHTANLMIFSNTSNVILDKITLDATTSGNAVQFSGNTSNITITNSKILSDSVNISDTNTKCIYKGIAGTLNGLIVKNCVIKGGHIAIALSGQNYDYVKNIEIVDNTISNQASIGIYGNYSRLWKITNNKITARSSSMTPSSWAGIFVNNSRENVIIEANRIYADNSAITNSLSGIQIQNLYVASVINNDIYLVSNASVVRGIEIKTPKGVDILHNSVFVTGTGGVTSFASVYLDISGTSYDATLNNNIFVAEGGENPFAFYFDGDNYTPSLYSYYRTNNNVYYSSINLAYVSGGIVPTLKIWEYIALNDTNSVRIRPVFLNVNQDLRIETSYDLLTDRLVRVDKDKNGISRNPTTARGAYEFTYANVDASLAQFVDMTVPEINQDMDISVELINMGAAPLLSATIKWSVNGIVQDSVIWSGNLSMAQKQTVFLGKTPLIWGRNYIKAWVSTIYDANNGNDTIETVVYPCSGTMSGTFIIGGQSSDFATVNDAMTALGICGISKPVILKLTSGIYPDIIITESIPGMSATNTITFTSAGRNPNSVIISTSYAGIMLRNINHLRFEYLTIDATKGSKGFQFLSECEDIEIRHCRILLDSSSVTVTSTDAGISKASSAGTANNIRIINNTISGGYYGIHFNGGTSIGDYGTDIIIDSNTITNNHWEGIRVLYSNLSSLSYNKIEAANNTLFNRWSGIYLENCNGTVNANRILQQSLINQPRGLYLKNFNNYSAENDTGLISNNEIIINGIASTTVNFYGIYADEHITADIINNSVLVNGANSAGIALYLGHINIFGSVHNNIFTSQTANPAIWIGSATLTALNTALANLNINHNNYYSVSGNVGHLGGSTPEIKSTMTDWLTIVSSDLLSNNINPPFINPSINLELSDYVAFYTARNPRIIMDINGKSRTVYTTKGAYGLTVREGYDLELSSVIIGSGNEQDLCKEDYVPVKYLVRNGGNLPYNFATDTMNLHFSMVTTDGLLNFDTVITIKTNSLSAFLTDTFEIKNNLNVSFSGDYQITAWLATGKDTIHSNDTVKTIYQTNKIKLPFDDDFSTITLENIKINSLHGTRGMWKVVQTGYDNIIQPAFGSGKLVFDDPNGSFSEIIIGQLELNRTIDPKLEFWYAHDNSNSTHSDLMDVRINFNGIDSTLRTIRRYDVNYTQPTWVNYTFDLSYFQNASCVTIYFFAASNGTSQHIDRIAITSNQDIAIKEILTSPLSGCDLKNQKLNVVLSNETNQDFNFDLPQNQTTILIEIELDGVAQQTLAVPVTGFLAGLSTMTVSTDFDYTPGVYNITTSLQMSTFDANPANNTNNATIEIDPELTIRIQKLSECDLASAEFKHKQVVMVKNAGNLELSGNIELILTVDTNGKEYFTTTKMVSLNLSPNDSTPITFDSAYIVPWIFDYEVEVHGYLICDSATINATASVQEKVDMNDLYIIDIINPPFNEDSDRVGDSIAVSIEIKNRNAGKIYNNEVNVGVLITDMNKNPIQRFSEEVPYIGEDVITYDFTGKYTVPALLQYLLIVYIENKDNYIYNDTVIMIRNTDKVSISNPADVSFTMKQNIPNPAKSNTIINYSIPQDGKITFQVHSINGQLLYTKDEIVSLGEHQIELELSGYASGIYFYTMEYKGQCITKRMSIKR